jgi:hypothetical protein
MNSSDLVWTCGRAISRKLEKSASVVAVYAYFLSAFSDSWPRFANCWGTYDNNRDANDSSDEHSAAANWPEFVRLACARVSPGSAHGPLSRLYDRAVVAGYPRDVEPGDATVFSKSKLGPPTKLYTSSRRRCRAQHLIRGSGNYPLRGRTISARQLAAIPATIQNGKARLPICIVTHLTSVSSSSE